MSRPAAEPPFSEPFPDTSYAEWRARVERELGERDFEAELVGELPGGLAVEPLYVERPAGDSSSARTLRRFLADGVWLRCSRVEVADRRGDSAIRALDEDLAGGCDAALVSTDSPNALRRLLERPEIVAHAVFLEPRGPGAEVAEVLLELHGTLAATVVGLGLDPLSALARDGGDGDALRLARPEMRRLLDYCLDAEPQTRVIAVSSLPIHNAGGTVSQELGWMLAALAHYLRLCESPGNLSLTRLAACVELRVASETDLFVGIAKLRALRCLWSRLLAACGVDEVPPALVHAETSQRSLTRRGARLNLVRVSGQVLAAVAGGADVITASAWDGALRRDGGSEAGRRLARNTHTILAHEAHLGRSADPAAGSYYVEHLTDALARAGWREMQRIEAGGGAAEHVLSGRLCAELHRAWKQRAQAIRAGELPIVGVTVFPDPEDPPAARSDATTAEGAGALPRRRDDEAAGSGGEAA